MKTVVTAGAMVLLMAVLGSSMAWAGPPKCGSMQQPVKVKDDEWVCVCIDPGKVIVNGQCKCKPGSSPDSHSGECVSDHPKKCDTAGYKHMENGKCVCNAGFSENDHAECVCNPPRLIENNECKSCAKNSHFDAKGKCECDLCFSRDSSNQCVAIANAKVSGGKCQCNPCFAFDGSGHCSAVVCGRAHEKCDPAPNVNKCICEHGYTLFNGNCIKN